MITADKVFKGSTEIIRIYKGTTLEWEKSVPIPDADAYIQDGLVFQLDGIDKGNDAWITNNIDRTKFEASGTATITLSATTKALLTAEEISQIEAMGYTLA